MNGQSCIVEQAASFAVPVLSDHGHELRARARKLSLCQHAADDGDGLVESLQVSLLHALFHFEIERSGDAADIFEGAFLARAEQLLPGGAIRRNDTSFQLLECLSFERLQLVLRLQVVLWRRSELLSRYFSRSAELRSLPTLRSAESSWMLIVVIGLRS